ncbi:hypothetical protein K1719_002993 [Acacia pycnantha]|nr:hypothetical protein K1719_002993 [Acacia pycnantha]
MFGKVVLSSIFVLLLIVSYTIYKGDFNIRSHFALPLNSSSPPCPEPDRPLRIYMYDLPRRFNVGMLERNNSAETPVTAQDWPPYPVNSGLRKQHSVEFWLMGSLIYDGDKDQPEAIRVSDPELADVFFVPFFSSLSNNLHGHQMSGPATEADHQLQRDVVEFLRKSKYWQRSGGRDHVIPMTHPNAFKFMRNHVNASIQIVVDFGRFPKSVSNLRKDVVSPYVHVVDTFTDDESQDPYQSRATLLFFRGGTKRKDEGTIRLKLAKILAGKYDDVRFEQGVASLDNIKEASKDMRLSKFCLDPAGDTPSSCRLFDAIVSHCVPVIVSDKIELPFEDEIDYTKFSVFFSFKEALEPGYMVDQLRKFPKDKWLEMWRQLKNISHYYEFHYPPKRQDAVNMLWRQVRHKLPGVRLEVHRSRRLKIPDWWRRRLF